jgi:cytochrome P450
MTNAYVAATGRTAAEIPDFPMSRAAGCPFDPPPALRALQARVPITKVRLWDDSTPWLVTRYADQRVLLADRRISHDGALPGFPYVSEGGRAWCAEERSFLFMDDPEHARLRRMVSAPFAIKRVEALRPGVQRVVEDLLSRLALEQVKTGGMSLREVATTGTLLLTAGHETTTNMIALGTLALLQHPDQLGALRDTDDPTLIADAVEELLRYLTIVHMGVRRVALAEIEIGGHVIYAGDGVISPNNVANRDEEVFADSDRLDVYRDTRGHLAFGFGVHQCLGQPLARIELQVVYGTLYRRIPTLRLAVDPDQLPFKNDSSVHGVYELPVTW